MTARAYLMPIPEWSEKQPGSITLGPFELDPITEVGEAPDGRIEITLDLEPIKFQHTEGVSFSAIFLHMNEEELLAFIAELENIHDINFNIEVPV